MSLPPNYQDQTKAVWQLGEYLQGGTLIENPFDAPVETELQGDPDQGDDDAQFLGAEQSVTALEALPAGKKDVSEVKFEPRLNFFLDGSLRAKFLGEYVHGHNSFPILITEVLCAVVSKQGRALEPHHIEKQIIFIFPGASAFPSVETAKQLAALNEEWKAANALFRIAFLLRDPAKIHDVRYSMLGKARDCMHSLEHDVAAHKLEREEGWLVMDGAIRKEEFLPLENTIGLAKSFSRKPFFDLGDDERRLSITSYLARIGVGERSAVFAKDQNVAFWYVRLRNFPPMEPLGGLVKVDFSLQKQKLSKERTLPEEMLQLVDELSAEIYANRTPSIYPYPRWPSFLYPVRIAEQMMRSRYTNADVLGHYAKQLKRAIGGGAV
jgi:hypothetical protein